MATPNGSIPKILASLLVFVGLNGLAGGYYGMDGAKNVPTEWLEGSPFKTYFIPSLILFVAVGFLSLIGGAAVFTRHRFAPLLSRLSGWVLVIWIVVQISLIGFVSWLQPAMFIAGITIIMLAKIAFAGRPVKIQ